MTAVKAPPDNQARLHALEAEIAKLRKINKVLMDRVERDIDAQGGNAFSLFQTSIILEGRVTERTSDLTTMTHQLIRQISERREAEQALRVAKAEAEEANLSKTKFLAAASHDLHQPLNAARLFVSSLREELGSGQPRTLVDRIDEALDALADLLTALLDISKLDAGVWPVAPTAFALGPLLKRLAAEYAPQAQAIGLALQVVPTSAIVRTDRILLDRILRNFISNALRYTENGRILLGCRRGPTHVAVQVWDTGVGIPESKLGMIFQEFHQLGTGPRRQERGVGLGLAIVERIARLLSLDIDVASWPGCGSRFGVSVPYATGPAEPTLPRAAGQALQTIGLDGRRVVVIDNDPDFLGDLAVTLRGWGCVPMTAASERQALDALESSGQTPDLIIVDYYLDDGARGTETIEAIVARLGAPVPALVLSVERSATLRAEIKALGHAFLSKPVARARLRSMIAHLCSIGAAGSRKA